VFVIFVFPLWGLLVIALDVLVLYALLTRIEEFTV
jgi:hypothetical protein